MRWFVVGVVTCVLGACLTVGGTHPAAADTATASWSSAGHDLANSRSNPDETTIGPANVNTLVPRWSRSFASNVAATPAVVNGVVYVADRSGALTAMSASTGAVIWTRMVSSYTGIAGDKGRATPAVGNGLLIFGDQPGSGTRDGVHVLAVNAATGDLVWNTLVETAVTAKTTGSVTLDGNVAYLGMSSNDEGSTQCCSFRGSVVALNATTGALLWKTYTVPSGYTGGAVWGSGPVVDHDTGLVYVGTGNNYTVPAGVCDTPGETGCAPIADDDYIDSLLALDPATGAVRWALRTLDNDTAVNACRDPQICGPDFDFGSAPNLIETTIGGQARTLVGIGSKSGQYWAADAATGALVWVTQVGPGGTGGGIQWGSSYDGTRIYVAVTNSTHQTWALQPGGAATTTGGMWSGLDPATGAILWQTADPQRVGDFGFVSSANGVVYAGSSAESGPTMYALDATSGAILWSFASGGSVMGGAAIVDGSVYWASDYYSGTCIGPAACPDNFRVYAFSLASGPPTAPTSVTAQQNGATTIRLAWAPPASPGGSAVTGYRILRNGVVRATLAATSRGYTYTSLSPGTSYTVGVAAVNASGAGPAVTSTIKISRTPGPVATFTVRQSGTSSAVLTWTPPISAGASAVSGYVVTRDGTDSAGHGPFSKTLAGSARSYTMTSLVNARTYTFTVTAVNSAGKGAATSAALTTSRTPSAPTGMTLLQTAPHDATITWTPPASAGASAITGYRITRTGTDLDGAGPLSVTVAAGTTSYVLTRLTPIISYTTTVVALNASGAGPAISRTFSLTT